MKFYLLYAKIVLFWIVTILVVAMIIMLLLIVSHAILTLSDFLVNKEIERSRKVE